jgi:hypothetical protein
LERLAEFVQVGHVRILTASVRIWLSCLGSWEAVGGISKSCAGDIRHAAGYRNSRRPSDGCSNPCSEYRAGANGTNSGRVW